MRKMPEEYKGDYLKKRGGSISSPRKWTKDEIDWVKKGRDEGYSIKEIAESTQRTETSVALKLKRVSKSNGKYNPEHLADKYSANKEFIEITNPKTLLDVFCGENNFYKNHYSDIKVTTNDKDPEVESNYSLDYLKVLCKLYSENNRYDVVDLDPFGSAYDGFDLAIKMANKGLVITFGELGHKRWKRLDYVQNRYDISSLEEFSLEKMIEKVVAIGKRNKKKLTPVITKEWRLIGRVYFLISEYKTDGAWNN